MQVLTVFFNTTSLWTYVGILRQIHRRWRRSTSYNNTETWYNKVACEDAGGDQLLTVKAPTLILRVFSTCSLRTAHWDTTETPPKYHRDRRPSTFRVNNPKLPLLGNHPFIVGIEPPLVIWGAIVWGCPNSWGYQWVPQISSKSLMTISEYWNLWWLGMF